MRLWKRIAVPAVFTFIFFSGLILGFFILSYPGVAHTPDSAEYLAASRDILSRGFAVLFDPPTHPEFPMSVLWFLRTPVYPAVLAIVCRLPLLPAEAWNFVILWAITVIATLALHLFLRSRAGGSWVPAILLPAIAFPWATSVMSDNLFLLALALFVVAFLTSLERPGWLLASLVLITGILSAFTKPVAAFACILIALAGLLDRRARWFSMVMACAFLAVVALWSLRNHALYGRFIFSQVTDFNMAFFNYPALLAHETGEDEWLLRDSLMRDFRQEVSGLGILSDDRAKTSLLAERAGRATGYMLSRPLAYAFCHLSYIPRVMGSLNLPAFHTGKPGPRFPAPGGRPGIAQRPAGIPLPGLLNVIARALCFLLAILGIPFWWRKSRTQALVLIIGTGWFVLSMGPAGDDRTSLPAVLFASVLAQGGWFATRNCIRTKMAVGCPQSKG